MKNSENIASILLLAGLAGIAYMLHKNSNHDENTPAEATRYPNPNGASRGYRNNNPLNIEYSQSTVWQGEIRPSTDKRFAQFENLAYGYRAAFKTLHTYMTKYGLNTLQQIIGRWDPGATANYVNFICQKTGWKPTQTFAPTDHVPLVKLVYHMAWMENGFKPALLDVNNGWKLYQSV